jgi:hypothetical protein
VVVEFGGTTTVVFAGGGLLLLIQPDSMSAATKRLDTIFIPVSAIFITACILEYARHGTHGADAASAHGL